MKPSYRTRREFLKTSTAAALAMSAGSALSGVAEQAEKATRLRGKADACIYIWLGGGAAQVDTWDPKARGDGKKKPGSYYDAVPTAIPGVQVCEHLKQTAPLLDRCAILRSLTHEVVNEHGAATNLVHTGRKPSETIIYPSIGSIVSHELGSKSDAIPAYVVMGYPNIARDPGFLGPQYGYVYLTQIETGPNGLMRPPDVDHERQRRREQLLGAWQQDYQQRHPADQTIQAQGEVSRQGLRMAGPQFMSVFDLGKEPSLLREAYGGEFGQRCLLARRLVQAGVRFVEVSFNLNFLNGTGWDTHNHGQLNQHLLIKDLDQALAALLLDLERNRLLDTTLVVVATEFGRPPDFDSGGGRGHQSLAFSSVLAGGGLRTGQVVGATDELGRKVVGHPVTIPDFHATIHCALGINPHKNLYTPDDRPVPITDYGKPIAELFG
jgi:hypothetical protein